MTYSLAFFLRKSRWSIVSPRSDKTLMFSANYKIISRVKLDVYLLKDEFKAKTDLFVINILS